MPSMPTRPPAGREAPAYYMMNCAHPSTSSACSARSASVGLVCGELRANASRRSHAELDAATELDAGNPLELGADYARLKSALAVADVIGGCCGTDHRHIAAMSSALLAA